MLLFFGKATPPLQNKSQFGFTMTSLQNDVKDNKKIEVESVISELKATFF